MVPVDDVSVVAPEHAEARPLLLELDGVAGGAITVGGTPATGDGVDDGSGTVVRKLPPLPPPPPPPPPEL
jgi:hypothetical protein